MGPWRRYRRWWLLTFLAGGLSACAAPSPAPPPQELALLLSPLEKGPYQTTLIYARSEKRGHPLAVVLNPKGVALSVLPMADLTFRTEALGEMDRDGLMKRIAEIPGEEFRGIRLQFAPQFEKWDLRRILRLGSTVGYLITVDPHLRYELRPGLTGQVFSLVLHPSRRFLEVVRAE